MSGAADLAALTPEQRALLELRLRRAGSRPLPARRRPDAAAALRLVPQPLGSGEFVLSFSQLRVWFVDQLESGSAFYNVASAVRLSGAFDRETLRRALDEVVVRHESLRTTFALRGPEPVQIIGPPRATRLPLVDLRAAAPAERDALARRHAAQLARQPFDLARGPLLRLLLVRPGDAEHVLVCVTHHIVSDWWSQRVLVRDLAVVYGALARGLPSPLPPLPVQYRDFAVWQRGWLRDGVLAEQLAYWRSRLAGAPTQLMLPLDRPRPAVQSYRGGHQLFAFRRELPAAVGALARQQGCTPFTVLFAAFQVLLCHRTGQEDLVISAPVSLPQFGGERRGDRVLRQHPAAARRPDRQSRLPRPAGARLRRDGGRPVAPAPAARTADRGAGAAAQLEATALPPGRHQLRGGLRRPGRDRLQPGYRGLRFRAPARRSSSST